MHLLMLGGKILYGRTMIRIFTLQRNYHVHNCNVHMKGRYDEAPYRAHFLIISIEFLFQRITLTEMDIGWTDLMEYRKPGIRSRGL